MKPAAKKHKKSFYWLGDFPEPSEALRRELETTLSTPVIAKGKYIPARWSAIRRQLAYMERALALLRYRHHASGIFCVQQFIALYACCCASLLRLKLPPVFLQPLIYVPRLGVFGKLWKWLFTTALNYPSLRIAFCHSASEIAQYQTWFPQAADKFQLLGFTIVPIAQPSADPNAPPYLFSAGTSCRDYATLFAAARQWPTSTPPLHVACKPTDIAGLHIPDNVTIFHDLWGDEYRQHLANAMLVIVPLQPLPVSAGQLVFLLSMSANRPLIATRTDTSTEFLSDATAWLVPPQDPAALAAAIQEAIVRPDLARAKAQAAHQQFLERHTPAAIARQCASAIAAAMS